MFNREIMFAADWGHAVLQKQGKNSMLLQGWKMWMGFCCHQWSGTKPPLKASLQNLGCFGQSTILGVEPVCVHFGPLGPFVAIWHKSQKAREQKDLDFWLICKQTPQIYCRWWAELFVFSQRQTNFWATGSTLAKTPATEHTTMTSSPATRTAKREKTVNLLKIAKKVVGYINVA